MVSIRHFIILTIICAIESSILRKFGDRNKRVVNGKRVPKGNINTYYIAETIQETWCLHQLFIFFQYKATL